MSPVAGEARGRPVKQYTTAEILLESGASREELEELKADGLLVPRRRWSPLPWGGDRYTEDQIGVLRWFVKTHRAARGIAKGGSEKNATAGEPHTSNRGG